MNQKIYHNLVSVCLYVLGLTCLQNLSKMVPRKVMVLLRIFGLGSFDFSMTSVMVVSLV